jgi:hypothetical protein
MAPRKRKRSKKSSGASIAYTVTVLVLLAAVVYLAFSVYDVFAPQASRSEPISVLVLNGCGTEGIGFRTAKHLRSLGFDVVDFRNAEGFSYDETIVVDRSGDMGSAIGVARKLRTANVIQQLQSTPLEDVVVIVGRDYKRFLGESG